MNLNKFARDITLKEGKKINLSIAQVKEVVGITLRMIKKMTLDEVVSILKEVKGGK